MQLDPLTKSALQHTLHCLLGCSIGEILGMVLATAFGLSNIASVTVAVLLAFFFGYLLTTRSLIAKGSSIREAVNTALATDTTSIISMEIVDNAFILMVPGAISAPLSSSLFWVSLLVSLIIAFVVTVPVNRWFLSRGSMHQHHH